LMRRSACMPLKLASPPWPAAATAEVEEGQEEEGQEEGGVGEGEGCCLISLRTR
jgi:hypothetical protein